MVWRWIKDESAKNEIVKFLNHISTFICELKEVHKSWKYFPIIEIN